MLFMGNSLVTSAEGSVRKIKMRVVARCRSKILLARNRALVTSAEGSVRKKKRFPRCRSTILLVLKEPRSCGARNRALDSKTIQQ